MTKPRFNWHDYDKIESLKTNGKRTVRSYKANRICKYDGCKTILSRYNPSKYCTVHQRERQLKK